MNELKELLLSVNDCYSDFADSMISYANASAEKRSRLISYLREHKEASSSDIIAFVMSFPDFYNNAVSLDAWNAPDTVFAGTSYASA